ncbi:prepilin peptidase [Phytobacter diazotrophicus]|uniref:prepilin peptidase n=1 Tax=Phytobacter diazotrophicus TaxID=395631 RepID=UPI000D7711F7|nr:type 4 prepilin peptidase 2 [Grimontella sp. AG753]TCW44807.1 type 4 prepilin peptidase 2 [Phytobacter diazotrophicus]
MAGTILFICIYLVLNTLLVWYDVRQGLLPDRFTCPLLWSGLFYCGWFNPMLLQEKVLGAIAGYVGFAALYWGYRFLRNKEGLGYGDVKFLAALGAWHGWEALPMLVFVAASLASGAACLMSIRRRSMQIIKNPLPFGPFLAGAGLFMAYQSIFRSMVNLEP